MSFFPDVKSGDKFKPNAALSNEVRHLLNERGGFSAKPIRASASKTVRITVYNASTVSMASGLAVCFAETAEKAGDAVPAIPFTGGTVSVPWGVLCGPLSAGQIGECMVAGAFEAVISSSTGGFVVPVAGGTAFQRADSGRAEIVHVSGGTNAVAILGGGVSVQSEPAPEPTPVTGYAGPFKVSETGAIYNGADAADTNAGTIVIGSLHQQIPRGTVTVGAESTVYATVYYDATADDFVFAFATTLSDAVTSAHGWYRELAHFDSDGNLHQTHVSGDIEIFGRWVE